MAEPIVNHFVHAFAAERYARDRPQFHPQVIARLRERLHLTSPLPCALDVGCGTGHSALALRAIADEVLAIDSSAGMLAAAPPAAGIRYVQSPAEALPCADGKFPLVTVSMAFHWFDRARFLTEAARVLQPKGWLVLYGYHFTKRLPGCPEFEAWLRDDFARRYPQTPRNGEPVTPAELEPHGLSWRERTEFLETRPYTAGEFAKSLLTFSNTVRAVAEGRETAADLECRLTSELTHLLGPGTRELEFAGWMTLIQKTGKLPSRPLESSEPAIFPPANPLPAGGNYPRMNPHPAFSKPKWAGSELADLG